MDEQLDNDLKKRIREVFENYEDPNADEGWLKLREKFPEKRNKNRMVAWFWLGAAAVLFLIFGIVLWKYNGRIDQKKFSYKKVQDSLGKNFIVEKEKPGIQHYSNRVTGIQKTKLAKSEPLATLSAVKSQGNSPVNDDIAHNPPGYLKDSIQKQLANNQIPDSVYMKVKHTLPVKNTQEIAGEKAINDEKTIEKPRQAAGSINSMFAEPQNGKKQKVAEKTKSVVFGVYAATYFNYAKGSANNINIGAGFTADFRISKNLKLETGLAVTQNSLNYSGDAYSSFVQNTFIAAATYNLQGAGTSNFTPATTIKNYNAGLVGLDIPLNIKYELEPGKDDFYILTGLSSGTFINETYTYQYNYAASSSPFAQQTQGITNSKNFGSFYFGKTVNFSFGVGLPFGKNRIFIEPFLKYPLGGLGAQDIRFGSGGINLKFNLQSPK